MNAKFGLIEASLSPKKFPFWVEQRLSYDLRGRDVLETKPACRGCFNLSGQATEAKALDSLFIDLKFEYRITPEPTGTLVLCLGVSKVITKI